MSRVDQEFDPERVTDEGDEEGRTEADEEKPLHSPLPGSPSPTPPETTYTSASSSPLPSVVVSVREIESETHQTHPGRGTGQGQTPQGDEPTTSKWGRRVWPHGPRVGGESIRDTED